MDTANVVLSFLGGSAVGALPTALVTVSHERRERLRERMLEAAETFLAAVHEAQESLWHYTLAASELRTAKDEAIEYSETAKTRILEEQEAWIREGRPDEDVPEPYRRAVWILDVFEAAHGVHNPLDTERREEARRAAESAREAIQDLLTFEGETRLAPLAGVLRESIRTHVRFMTGLQSMGDTAEQARRALYQVHGSIPRIVLLYPSDGDQPPEVAQKASATALLLILNEISAALGREKTAAQDETVIRVTQQTNDAIVSFSAAASERTRSRWRL